MTGLPISDSPEHILDDIRAALAGLETLPLPEGAGRYLEDSHRSLDRLSTLTIAREDQFQQSTLESAQSNARFFSLMTHELRLPMTSIKGYADLLRQGAAGTLNEQQLSFLGVITNNINRMAALLSDLSDIARLDDGRLKLNLTPFPVNSYLEIALHELHPLLLEKRQLFNTDLPDTAPSLLSDPVRLVQVLAILIRNAIMYTQEGGAISIRVMQEGETVCLEVRDNGHGIKPEEQNRLFSPFFRSEDPYVREQQGWGLSLYLAYRLVEAMGGAIGVESVPGEGSTFWLRLPAASRSSTSDPTTTQTNP